MVRTHLVIFFAITFCGCSHHDEIVRAEGATGGYANEGEHLLYSYNCGACHVIPGIAEARGTVGPPLGGFANRTYIAGALVNTPENLIRWIKDPKQVEPETAMPKLGVTNGQAVDIAAYLYTLR
jgi:cytochrome c